MTAERTVVYLQTKDGKVVRFLPKLPDDKGILRGYLYNPASREYMHNIGMIKLRKLERDLGYFIQHSD
jgi:hypothetical protein